MNQTLIVLMTLKIQEKTYLSKEREASAGSETAKTRGKVHLFGFNSC